MVSARDSPRNPLGARVLCEADLQQFRRDAVERAERDAQGQVVAGPGAAKLADESRNGWREGSAARLDDESDLAVSGRQSTFPDAVSSREGMTRFEAGRGVGRSRFRARARMGSIRKWLRARGDSNSYEVILTGPVLTSQSTPAVQL